MGIWAFLALAIAALVIGLVSQMMGTPRFSYDWLITGIAAFTAGFIASEFLGPASTWGPEWDGMFYVPALIGSLLVGAIVELILRTTSPQTAV